jgi:hypothetical protein
MRQDQFSYVRLTRSSVLGALIALVFDFVVTFLTSSQTAFSVQRIPSYLAFLLVGFAGGWLFELFKIQTEVTAQSGRALTELEGSVQTLTNKITYQDQALAMLISAPRHTEALTALIKASLMDNFRNIPYVGVPTYLQLLSSAIRHSDGYEGIQRNPFRWYRDTNAGHYLNGLRNKQMSVKTRLVLIDDHELPIMQQDLADEDVMGYYWRHTGDVETYWMSVSEFRRAFPGLVVPRDLALYDRQLWVAYDETTQTLAFNVLPKDAVECRLFEDLHEMIMRGSPELKRVEPAGRSPGAPIGG